jgi:lipid-A-disaccharide synthase
MRVGIVAGEASGDLLGAGLARELQRRVPGVEIRGIAGPRMVAAGVHPLFDADELAVMGLVEVLGRLPRLLHVRRAIARYMLDWRPDVFIGIDAPDFNLPLETRLRAAHTPTVHYVSPSVWAWRRGRVNVVDRAADTVLCLLPFEPEHYHEVAVHAVHVGHPLAKVLRDTDGARDEARQRLAVSGPAPVVAVLPGSRGSELRNLGAIMAGAVGQLSGRGIRFVAPMVNDGLATRFRTLCARFAPGAELMFTEGGAHDAMRAADVVLTASGTATLEAMLLDRPMVVAYRLAPLTAWFLRTFKLMHTQYYALPNLLGGRPVVPELLQEAATPAQLASETTRLLDDDAARMAQVDAFHALRARLGEDADGHAAEAVLELVGRQ